MFGSFFKATFLMQVGFTLNLTGPSSYFGGILKIYLFSSEILPGFSSIFSNLAYKNFLSRFPKHYDNFDY